MSAQPKLWLPGQVNPEEAFTPNPPGSVPRSAIRESLKQRNQPSHHGPDENAPDKDDEARMSDALPDEAVLEGVVDRTVPGG